MLRLTQYSVNMQIYQWFIIFQVSFSKRFWYAKSDFRRQNCQVNIFPILRWKWIIRCCYFMKAESMKMEAWIILMKKIYLAFYPAVADCANNQVGKWYSGILALTPSRLMQGHVCLYGLLIRLILLLLLNCTDAKSFFDQDRSHWPLSKSPLKAPLMWNS